MDAKTAQLDALFDGNKFYQVPLFQRPYVWNEKENWGHLWEDIQNLLDKRLRTGRVHPHFMGAIVLEQVPNPAGSIETRLVIDGQQRFTTLQLFLVAARNLCASKGAERFAGRFTGLIENAANRAETEEERFKLLPTNSDRPAFRLVCESGADAEVEQAIKGDADLSASNIIGAYRYFSRRLVAWAAGELDDELDADALSDRTVEDRLECIWLAVQDGLQLVVINLAIGDETQVIFETLNARGTELLPADLIKNFLFRKVASVEGATEKDVEKLYAKHWERFDSKFWREPVQQGRIYRPRIDLFINHYLSMMTRDEVKSTHLFNAYKRFVEEASADPSTSIPVPTTPAKHVAHLAELGGVFLAFYDPTGHDALALFLRRLDAVDTATVYPFLLYAHSVLMPDNQKEFDKVLGVLESFLMRRLITNFTPKNYNRLFVDLIKAVERSGGVSATAVAVYLSRGAGESTKFPTDDELLVAIFEQELYGRLAQRKVRAILEALDAYAMSSKSEAVAMPTKLTIEHVMPQAWLTHWPLPEEAQVDELTRQKAMARRSVMLNTLGNLTLINEKFNSSLQNAAWTHKRPELLKFSKMNLTRYFHGIEADVWDEAAIRARTEKMFAELLQIWPAPRTILPEEREVAE
ncbi:DUF262 domain-containing protein [Stenotrophomonas rhizophila]|uniref:DUF262 domain-containing protein n=1 Tax=Stenotrophomonas rhizophila TaxID=216778 RepID=UPI00112F1AB9|nr:DUF262 domain-containing protein [Stenotrophomonas rhizophila]